MKHKLENNPPPRIVLGNGGLLRVEVIPGLGGCISRVQAPDPRGGRLIDLAQHNPDICLDNLDLHRTSRHGLFSCASIFFPSPPGRHLNGKISLCGTPAKMKNPLDQEECLHGVVPYGQYDVVADSISDESVTLVYDSRRHPGYAVGKGKFTLELTHRVSRNRLSHSFKFQNVGRTPIEVGIATHPMLLKDPLGSKRNPWLSFTSQGHCVPRGGIAIPSGMLSVPTPAARDFTNLREVLPLLDEAWYGFQDDAVLVHRAKRSGEPNLVVHQGGDNAYYAQVWSLNDRIWAFEPHDTMPSGLYIAGEPDLERTLTEEGTRFPKGYPRTGIPLQPGEVYQSEHWMKVLWEEEVDGLPERS